MTSYIHGGFAFRPKRERRAPPKFRNRGGFGRQNAKWGRPPFRVLAAAGQNAKPPPVSRFSPSPPPFRVLAAAPPRHFAFWPPPPRFAFRVSAAAPPAILRFAFRPPRHFAFWPPPPRFAFWPPPPRFAFWPPPPAPFCVSRFGPPAITRFGRPPPFCVSPHLVIIKKIQVSGIPVVV